MFDVGFLGGSYNPPQKAHIATAEIAHEKLGLHDVYLMPTLQNRLKLVTGMESFENRLAMCQEAAKGKTWLKVTDFERQINDNRSLYVMRAHKALHPDWNHIWLTGSDSLMQMPLWPNGDGIKLMHEFPMVVFNRPDQFDIIKALKNGTLPKEIMELYVPFSQYKNGQIGWTVLNHKTFVISATSVRKLLCQEKTPADLDPQVMKYIKTHNLYLKDTWYVPEIEESEIESLAVQANIRPTLYDPRNIYVDADANVFQSCNRLIKYTGETIRDVVALRPERAALHALIVTLSTEFKLRDHKDLKEKIDGLLQEQVLPLLKLSAAKLDNIERAAQAAAAQYADDGSTDELPELACTRLQKAQQHAEWPSLPQDTKQEITHDIIVNTILRAKIENFTMQLVQKLLQSQDVQTAYNLEKLDKNPAQQTTIYLVAGGPAVGKARVIKALAEGNLGVPGFAASDFCKNNPDFYKEILLSPQDLGPYVPYYGSLTHQESFLISDKIYLTWQEMIESGQAPNFLLDTARPHPWLMDILASAKAPINIFMVTCDVEKALERSYARGLETKRFMPTKTLLTFHQSEYGMLSTAMHHHAPNVFLIDTNGAAPVLAAEWLGGRKFAIHNLETWRKFENSQHINVNAINTTQLYLQNPSPLAKASPTIL